MSFAVDVVVVAHEELQELSPLVLVASTHDFYKPLRSEDLQKKRFRFVFVYISIISVRIS